MKKLFTAALAVIILFSISACGPEGPIQTESGLQYTYNKKGDGRMVEKGSLVKTKLSLMVEDSVVWTSYQAPDSLFTFVVGYSGVIAGFEEMALLMREGDDVNVSIPDSLAYGATGAGGVIPPNATIVYDRYEMVSVSEPKEVMTDTLAVAYQSGGEEAVIALYDAIVEAGELNNYHMELDLVQDLLGAMAQTGQFNGLQAMSTRMRNDNWQGDQNMLNYYDIVATQGLGDMEGAMAKAKALQAENPDEQWVANLIAQLEAQKAQAANE